MFLDDCFASSVAKDRSKNGSSNGTCINADWWNCERLKGSWDWLPLSKETFYFFRMLPPGSWEFLTETIRWDPEILGRIPKLSQIFWQSFFSIFEEKFNFIVDSLVNDSPGSCSEKIFFREETNLKKKVIFPFYFFLRIVPLNALARPWSLEKL